MIHLKNYKDFIISEIETSEYVVPIAAVIPTEGDKIWQYIKKSADISALWGIDLKNQEKENILIRDKSQITESMFFIDLNNVLFETEQIDINLTKHTNDRSHMRYKQQIDISKENIFNLVNKTKDQLINASQKFHTFVIHSTKTNLNIVGELIQKAGHYIFNVITVMVKSKFSPKDNDKYIEIYENIDKNSVFGIKVK